MDMKPDRNQNKGHPPPAAGKLLRTNIYQRSPAADHFPARGARAPLRKMIRSIMIPATISIVALLHFADSSGISAPKKVQIHVPHNIQHHHHTHTKYHFITLPARANSNAINNTGINGFQGMFPLVPVMPLTPFATQQPTTTTTAAPNTPAPAINPPPGIQTNALPVAGAPGIQNNAFPAGGPPGIQTNTVPAAGLIPMGTAQTRGMGPSGPQQQPFIPLVPVLARQSSMYVNNPGYYDYNDNLARRSQKYYNVEAPPTSPPQPMKFKTVINVHETKKIPLSDLFNIANFLQKDPPRRIKVEVHPEKTTHVKQQQFDRETLHNAVQSNPAGSIQHYSFSDAEGDNLQFDPDTAAFQIQSRQEVAVEKPEYTKLKELLEKHIQQDFPGLKVKAELVHVPPSLKERSDLHNSATNKATAIQASDLKHIGYVVITDSNDHRFVSLGETQR